MRSDFPAVFAALREMLRRHADGLIVHADTPTDFTLITLARTAVKKRAVSSKIKSPGAVKRSLKRR